MALERGTISENLDINNEIVPWIDNNIGYRRCLKAYGD